MGVPLSATRGGPGFFPISIRLSDKPVLVVGGGRSALVEVRRLLDFGALVEVVAPHPVSEMQELAVVHGHKLKIVRRKFDPSDEDRIFDRQFILVYAASGSHDQDEYVSKIAGESGVLVCRPDLSEPQADVSFVMPSVRKRGHVKIAVSTDGYCPALSRALLERIEASLGAKIDNYVIFLDGLRERFAALEQELSTEEQRQHFARALAESEELVLAFQRENFEEAVQLLSHMVAEIKESS